MATQRAQWIAAIDPRIEELVRNGNSDTVIIAGVMDVDYPAIKPRPDMTSFVIALNERLAHWSEVYDRDPKGRRRYTNGAASPGRNHAQSVLGKPARPERSKEDVVAEMKAARVLVSAAVPNPDRDTQYLVGGLIRPAALVVMASQEGVGKSIIGGEIAIRGAMGTGALFNYPPFAIGRQFKTVLLDEENGEDEEADREEAALVAIGAARTDLGDRYIRYSFSGADLMSADGRARIEAAVEIDDPDLLVLDTATLMVGEEWGPDLKTAIRWLRALADDKRVAILLLVHLVKPPRDARSGNRQTAGRTLSDVMGQWARPVDVVIVVSGASGEDRVHFDVYKRVPKQRLVLAQASGVWDVVGTASNRPGINLPTGVPPSGLTILRAIADGIDPLDEEAVGLSRATFHRTVKGLRDAGLVARGQPYALTEAGDAAVSPESYPSLRLLEEDKREPAP